MAKTLRPSIAPNLPLGPVEYEQRYMDQLLNVLRLYFNTVDNTLRGILENSGGRFINSPHIFASSSSTQYATGDDTPTLLEWSTVSRAEGFSLNVVTDAATATYSGAYRVDYRLQAENSAASAHTVWVWLRIDGTNVTNSCTKFTIPANTGVDSYVVCESFIEVEILGGSDVQIMWATDKAATSGGGLGVYIEAYPLQTSPFACPAIPSAYGSISFVSELSQ